MGQRYYDPSLGIFTSMDPAAINPNDPRTFNRYAYANNNSYRYVDPDGNSPVLIIPLAMGVGAVFGGATNALMQYHDTGHIQWSGLDGVIDAAGDGAMFGGMFGLLGGAEAGAVNSAVAKGANSSVNGLKLEKQLASEAQLSQLSSGGGAVISHPAKQANRIASQTGRNPANIQKVSSDARIAKDGQPIQTHSFRDAATNELIEPKTMIGD